MTGILGGILLVIHFTGGTVLYLLIGKSAWRENTVARLSRLVFGATAIGVVLGLFCYFSELGDILIAFLRDKDRAPITVEGGIVLTIFLTICCNLGAGILEGVRSMIEYKNN